jgi:hypothetical protein
MIKSRLIKWADHVGDVINAYKILVGEPEEMRPFGRPRREWTDNIRMNLKEIGREGVDWMHLAQVLDEYQAIENTVTKFRVP